MKRSVKIVIGIGVLLAIVLNVWLIVRVPNKAEPERVANVPKTAIWKGGVDEGFWIDFVDEQTSKVRLKIYNDYNGEMVLDADFITSECNAPKGVAFIDSINYFDTKAIVLLNGCEIKAVYPAYGGTFWEIDKEHNK